MLYLAMLSIGMGQTVIYAVMPALGRELGLDSMVVSVPLFSFDWQPGKLAITSLSAMTALIFAVVAPYWGRRSDFVGRKPIILLGLLGYTIGTLLFNGAAYLGFQGLLGGLSLWLFLLLARIIHASIMSATFPAANAYIVDITPLAERAKGLGRMSAANQLGVLLGPVMASAVLFGLLAPLFIQATITFFCAVLVYFFLAESLVRRETEVLLPQEPRLAERQRENQLALDGAISAQVLAENVTDNVVEVTASRPEAHGERALPKLRLLDRRYRFILPVGFFLYTLQGMVQQTLGFYCEDVLGLDRISSVQYYALAMMASSVAMLCVQFLIVQRASLTSIQLMRWGLPFCALGYALIAVTDGLSGVLLGMATFGFGVGMVMPGFSATASYTVSAQEQGSLAGILGATVGMGFVVGPLLGGLLYNHWHNAPAILAALSLSILSVYVVKNSRFDRLSVTAVD